MKLDFSIPAAAVEIWPHCFSLCRFISVKPAGVICNQTNAGVRFPPHTRASIVSFEFVLVITGLMWGFIPPFRNSCNNIPAHVDDETGKKCPIFKPK